MEITEIKGQLSISQVLQHYGLKPDRHDRLLCPFHLYTPAALARSVWDIFFCLRRVVILSAKSIKVLKNGVLWRLLRKNRA